MKQNTKKLIGLFFSGLVIIALAAGAVVGANAMMKGFITAETRAVAAAAEAAERVRLAAQQTEDE